VLDIISKVNQSVIIQNKYRININEGGKFVREMFSKYPGKYKAMNSDVVAATKPFGSI